MAANPAPTDPAVTGPDEHPSAPDGADSFVVEPLDPSGPSPDGGTGTAPVDPPPVEDHGAQAQGMIPARGRRRTKIERRLHADPGHGRDHRAGGGARGDPGRERTSQDGSWAWSSASPRWSSPPCSGRRASSDPDRAGPNGSSGGDDRPHADAGHQLVQALPTGVAAASSRTPTELGPPPTTPRPGPTSIRARRARPSIPSLSPSGSQSSSTTNRPSAAACTAAPVRRASDSPRAARSGTPLAVASATRRQQCR